MTLSDERPSAARPPSVHETVRRTTADHHRRLEALPLQARLLSDDYRLDEYRSLLALTLRFYAPLAAELHAVPHGARASSRIDERIARLRADLRDLGELDSVAGTSPLLPPVDTPDRSLGCMYVIEGSALGGRMISRHLARVFAGPQGADIPLRFLRGDEELTTAQWRAFCATLETDTVDVGEVCTAACATFDAFGRWLAQ